ncbi:MAG: 3-deoxy-manno-octulosonate cytidylyltransferase [Phycisphaerales bacterium]
MPDVIGIIPARLASTRFPNKVLADATGWPLIRHVHAAAAKARSLSRLVIATDEPSVLEAVRAFGAEAILTRRDHPNGTSRLAEAARLLDLPADSIVVNVQGDEPELDASIIDRAVASLRDSAAPMATAAVPFDAADDPTNPNIVKVVLRADGTAMYFSRSLIPFQRDAGSRNAAAPHAAAPEPTSAPLRHIGLYAYRRPFLDVYLALPPAPPEVAEQLEQLRALYHGHTIAVALCHGPAHAGIDTPEQYGAFVKRFMSRR